MYLCIVKARSDEASRNYATFSQNNPFIPQEKAVLSSRLHRDTKWFPVPSSSEPMSLKGFAKHLAEHGKLASYDMLVLVLQNIVGSFVICIDYHRAGGMRRWAFSKSSGVSSSMEKRSVVSTMRKVWP